MNDYTTTSLAFTITVTLLWLTTRKDKKVSNKWLHPTGILGRTAILIFVFHLIFVACGISALKGFLFVILFVVISIPGIYLDPFAVLFLVTGWLFYQWIFWFPSKEQMILSSTVGNLKRTKQKMETRRGFAASDMNPIGKIEIEGKQYDARSTIGFISKGDAVEIENENGFELQVKKIEC